MIQVDKYISVQNLEEWDEALQLGLIRHSTQKGELILRAGQPCKHLYYIIKGLIRVYYLDLNGNEITHWFSPANSLITSPFSYLKDEENILSFATLEDSEFFLITSAQMEAMVAEFKAANDGFRKINAEFAMVLSRRVMGIHTQTAEARYLKLLEDYPDLFQKANLSHIASFLGITPQSLSRIRRNL